MFSTKKKEKTTTKAQTGTDSWYLQQRKEPQNFPLNSIFTLRGTDAATGWREEKKEGVKNLQQWGDRESV